MKTGIFIVMIFTFLGCQKVLYKNQVPEKDPPVLMANPIAINAAVGGYYSCLPLHYDESLNRYPLLVSLHGGGQFGNGNTELEKVLETGTPLLLKENLFPPNFTVNGENYSFVIVIPQFSRVPTTDELFSFIDYVSAKFFIDTKRIYLEGLSRGGIVAADAAAAYPLRFAALVTMSGASDTGNIPAKCKNIVAGNLPVWSFHNNTDHVVDVSITRNFIGYINSYAPAIKPKYTEFETFGYGTDHDSWTKASDPAYKENGMNIYEWMLLYHR